jgi:peptidoglycan hydrolase-like protein with peptidoglycan-binding domain
VDISGGGFTNSEVARIQKALKAGGYRPGPIDGAYGQQTRSALNRFEKKKKLKRSPGSSIYLISISRLGIAC